jgi:hypothetical protein
MQTTCWRKSGGTRVATGAAHEACCVSLEPPGNVGISGVDVGVCLWVTLRLERSRFSVAPLARLTSIDSIRSKIK